MSLLGEAFMSMPAFCFVEKLMGKLRLFDRSSGLLPEVHKLRLLGLKSIVGPNKQGPSALTLN